MRLGFLTRSGLACLAATVFCLPLISGCGDTDKAPNGAVVKEDPAVVKSREDMIKEAYSKKPAAPATAPAK